MPRELPFDKNDYVCVRGPVVDTLTAVRYKDGVKIETTLDEAYLRKMADTMNREFDATGELSPIIIGHTEDGKPESDYQTVGLLHNHSVEPFENTIAHWADHWFPKEQDVVVEGVPLRLSAKEVLRRWPRRSGEIWLNKYSVHPHCLLGASAPERPLGILKLSKDGGDTSIAYESPGVLTVPEPKPDNESVADLPIVKELKAMLAQVTQVVAELTAISEKMQAPADAPGGDAPAGDGEGDPQSEKELEDLLNSIQGGGDGKEPKEPEPKDDEKVKLQAELSDAKLKLARAEIKEALAPLGRQNDEALVNDLLIVPLDVRARQISRLPSLTAPGRKDPNPGNLNDALKLSRPEGAAPKRIETQAQQIEVSAHAATHKLDFPTAAVALGYTL